MSRHTCAAQAVGEELLEAQQLVEGAMSLQTSLLGSERESGGFTVPSSDAEHPAAPAPAPAPAPAAGTSPLPTAAAAAAAQSYAALAGRTWKLALAAFLVTTHRNIDLQIFQPYAYSRVSCCGLGGGPMLSPSYSTSHSSSLSGFPRL